MSAFDDLAAEGESLAVLVADIDPAEWALPTPAPRWTVAHQIAHLASVFRMAALSASEPDRFIDFLSRMRTRFANHIDTVLAEYLAEPPDVLVARWRAECAAAAGALRAVPPGGSVPWLAGPIPPERLAGYGMVELFGHGQDVADALGVRRQHTDRLRHLVGHAFAVWDHGYESRDLPAPAHPPRLVLTAPSGSTWEFGQTEGGGRVEGPAVDFCLLVTRRRHRADLALRATGPEADRWLDIAQAYRGPSGPGRAPGQFAAVSG